MNETDFIKCPICGTAVRLNEKTCYCCGKDLSEIRSAYSINLKDNKLRDRREEDEMFFLGFGFLDPPFNK